MIEENPMVTVLKMMIGTRRFQSRGVLIAPPMTAANANPERAMETAKKSSGTLRPKGAGSST